MQQLLHEHIHVLPGQLGVGAVVVSPGLRQVAAGADLESAPTVVEIGDEFQRDADRLDRMHDPGRQQQGSHGETDTPHDHHPAVAV